MDRAPSLNAMAGAGFTGFMPTGSASSLMSSMQSPSTSAGLAMQVLLDPVAVRGQRLYVLGECRRAGCAAVSPGPAASTPRRPGQTSHRARNSRRSSRRPRSAQRQRRSETGVGSVPRSGQTASSALPESSVFGTGAVSRWLSSTGASGVSAPANLDHWLAPCWLTALTR